METPEVVGQEDVAMGEADLGVEVGAYQVKDLVEAGFMHGALAEEGEEIQEM